MDDGFLDGYVWDVYYVYDYVAQNRLDQLREQQGSMKLYIMLDQKPDRSQLITAGESKQAKSNEVSKKL